MDREILFRGKRLDNGQWVEGFYCKMAETTYALEEDYKKYQVPTHHYIIVESMTDWGLPNRLLCVEIDPETICKYTGLKDKYGRKFEGDIFQADNDECILWYVIAWDDELLEWQAYNVGGDCDVLSLSDFRSEDIQVVGNIYDNPELLEGGTI